MKFSPTLIYTVTPPEPYTYGGETPLHGASSVTAWTTPHEGLRVVANGQLLKRDGTPGRYARSTTVNLFMPQPPWMAELITDARRRLSDG